MEQYWNPKQGHGNRKSCHKEFDMHRNQILVYYCEKRFMQRLYAKYWKKMGDTSPAIKGMHCALLVVYSEWYLERKVAMMRLVQGYALPMQSLRLHFKKMCALTIWMN